MWTGRLNTNKAKKNKNKNNTPDDCYPFHCANHNKRESYRRRSFTYLWNVYYLSGDFNIPPRHSRNLWFLVCTKQLFVTSVLAPAGRWSKLVPKKLNNKFLVTRSLCWIRCTSEAAFFPSRHLRKNIRSWQKIRLKGDALISTQPSCKWTLKCCSLHREPFHPNFLPTRRASVRRVALNVAPNRSRLNRRLCAKARVDFWAAPTSELLSLNPGWIRAPLD